MTHFKSRVSLTWIDNESASIELHKPTQRRPKPLRVLLVEDSLPVRSRIRKLIEDGCSARVTAEAATAAEALRKFATEQPDAVVLDLQLAEGDGFAVLPQIKKQKPECLVIVLTNFHTPEYKARCLSWGADYFFNKSREFEQVPRVLAHLSDTPSSPPIL
jgi:DNA-binding NarL/FixJ family response regulator